MVKITVSVLQMGMEESGQLLVAEPGFEPGPSDSSALLLNLTPLCFPSLCCKAGFLSLGTTLGAE